MEKIETMLMNLRMENLTEQQVDMLLHNKKISREQHKKLLIEIATKRNKKNIERKKYRASMSSTKWC